MPNCIRRVALAATLLVASPAGAQETPAVPMSAVRVVSDIGSMPVEQFRALIADEGLEVCSAERLDTFRDLERLTRCHTMTRADLTDDALRRLQAAWHFGARSPRLSGESLACRRTSAGEHCHAHRHGPSGVEWDFRGVGAARRLVRVRSSSLQEG